ncbi:sugar phosphate isomerase/epimerase family protein [Helcococcus kunzii]|uniref:sugar phosphate isomerase/epimerase family protein n=1 Tax=Helcococcus kunzii TaxID=40091 RepID=UPI0024AD42BE|nr:TIM barrel protein [Helcococcus kunzii]
MKFKISAMNCHYRFYSLETFFENISKIGFRYAEIWTSPQHFFVDYSQNDDVETLKLLSEKYDIKIQCICPEQTNPKPHNIASSNSKIIERTLNYYKRIIDIAYEVGADKIVTTSGWGFLDTKRETSWKRSVNMQKNICKYALRKNIKVCIEALQPIETNLVNNIHDLEKYLSDVNEDNLYVCIDLGAMAKAGETIGEYFQKFGDKIAHVHFVDGNPTGHLAIGDGSRDYLNDLRILEENGYSNFLSLEIASEKYYKNPFNADKQSFNNIRRYS